MAKVNTARQAIRTLRADAVRISAPGLPSLKARLYYAAPRQFRLQGDFLLSREMDIGMNQEFFWMWGRNWTGALLYARHDQLSLPHVAERVGLDPNWFLDALGLVELEPSGQHHGPFAHGPGAMEIHTQRLSLSGQVLTRVLVMHAVYGWLLEARLQDERGQVLAAARMSRHRFYAEAGVSLPDVVEIHLAPGTDRQTQFQVDIGGYVVNEPITDPAAFALPQLPDVPLVNLAEPPPGALRAAEAIPLPTSPVPAPIYRPEYRGYSRR